MNKGKIIFAVLCLLFMLAGCSGDAEDAANVQENGQAVEQEQTVDDDQTNGQENETTPQESKTQEAESPYPFIKFELDVDYKNDKDFDVEYDNEGNKLEAEIDDDLGNNHLFGEEALAQLKPIFEQFTFDKDTTDDAVISEVIEAFEIDEEFYKFELEVKFKNGIEKEYKLSK